VSAPPETEAKRSEPGSGWPVLIGVAFVTLVAAALIAVGAWHGLQSGLRLEFGKAGLNLVVLAIVGAGVTAAVQQRAARRELRWRLEAEDRETRRQRDAEDREARRQDSDYALGVLRDVIANYNRLKAARRAMRAVGLDRLTRAARATAASGTDPITSTQAAEFERQMGVVAEVQLGFEAVARELDTRLDKDAVDDGGDAATRSGPAPEPFQIAIAQLAEYVEAIVREWEHDGREVAKGDDPERVASRVRLQAFLRSSRNDPHKEFRTNAAEPLRTLQLFFRQHLLMPLLRGEPTSTSATSPDPPGGHTVARNAQRTTDTHRAPG
jgi:hypothetical protein